MVISKSVNRDIKHTYTIQWVGPLTYDECKEYVKGTDVLSL